MAEGTSVKTLSSTKENTPKRLPALLDLQGSAEYLGFRNSRALYWAIRTGAFPVKPIKIGGNEKMFFRIRDLQRWIESHN